MLMEFSKGFCYLPNRINLRISLMNRYKILEKSLKFYESTVFNILMYLQITWGILFKKEILIL